VFFLGGFHLIDAFHEVAFSFMILPMEQDLNIEVKYIDGDTYSTGLNYIHPDSLALLNQPVD
jgi:hypothetical protein